MNSALASDRAGPMRGGGAAGKGDTVFRAPVGCPTTHGDAAAYAIGRMPRAILCLTSAAWFEGLLTEPPRELWLALSAAKHGARLGSLAHRLIRWTDPAAFEIGVVKVAIGGVSLSRTAGARTIVDLVHYSRHVRGEHVGIEAARRWVAQGGEPREMLNIAGRLRIPAAAMHTLSVMAAALDHGSTADTADADRSLRWIR